MLCPVKLVVPEKDVALCVENPAVPPEAAKPEPAVNPVAGPANPHVKHVAAAESNFDI